MDISCFCSTARDERRIYAKYPWFLDGETVATDSRILVCKKDIGPWTISNEGRFPTDAVRDLLKQIPEKKYTKFDKSVLNQIGSVCSDCNGVGRMNVNHCPECDGSGIIVFETRYNEYEVECNSCNGYGDRKSPHPNGNKICENCGGVGIIYPAVKVNNTLIAYKYLHKISQINGLEISVSEKNQPLFFRSGKEAVNGVVMAIHES